MGARTMRRLTAAIAALALGLALAAMPLRGLFGPAWAEDDPPLPPEEGANLVDPTQRADNSFIYDTTVASLYSQPTIYDSRTVQIVGEVIGDRIRGDKPTNSWITLTETIKEDASTISLIMSDELADQIDRYGRYGVHGTTLQVRGTYHQACVEHDGLPDIHVTTSSVLEQGVDLPDELAPGKLVPGLATILVGAGLLVLYRYTRERMR